MTIRSLHRWFSILFAIPVLLILGTGVMLASRSFWPWMQPEYPSPASAEIKISFPQMLSAVRSVPQAKMQSWDDVSQIDIRPKTGQIRLRSRHDHWEVQVDPATGAVLGYGQRRVAWFTALHQGALWGALPRYAIFYPAAWVLLFLCLSGVWIFFQPAYRRWRARSRFPKKPLVPRNGNSLVPRNGKNLVPRNETH